MSVVAKALTLVAGIGDRSSPANKVTTPLDRADLDDDDLFLIRPDELNSSGRGLLAFDG